MEDNYSMEELYSLGQELADRIYFASQMRENVKNGILKKIDCTDADLQKYVNSKLLKNREFLVNKKRCAIKESIILYVNDKININEMEDGQGGFVNFKIKAINKKIATTDDALNLDELVAQKQDIEEKTGTKFEYVPLDLKSIYDQNEF